MSLVYASPSISITEWLWDFGDGTQSTEQNPSHIYSNPGVYTVTLTVVDASSATDTEVKTSLVAVDAQAPVRAQFTTNS